MKTFDDWISEYIPPINRHLSLRACMLHVEHKWLGMRKHVLRSYGLFRDLRAIRKPYSLRNVRIGALNCALCVNTAARWGQISADRKQNCKYCPLHIFNKENSCMDEWLAFLTQDTVRPMLTLIKRVKKIVFDQGLTWADMEELANK